MIYPSKTCDATISNQYHGLGRALATLKPNRIAQAALKNSDDLPFLIKEMCNLINKECEEMCRPSTRSSFRNSSFFGYDIIDNTENCYELQTIAPTLWKVSGMSVSPNMTLIDNNENFKHMHVWQQHVCLELQILTWVLAITSQHEPFQFRSQKRAYNMTEPVGCLHVS